jgi:hypothetical protein
MAGISVRGMLEPLNYRELEAFRRRAKWCHKDERLSESELREYLSRATSAAISSGSISESDVIQFLRGEIIE